MKSPTSSSVGPKKSNRSARNERPVSSGLALTTTPLARNSDNNGSLAGASAGRSVENLVLGLPVLPLDSWGATAVLNVPWISLPCDVSSLTLFLSTCVRNCV
jgi:hypothetical protein